jgi:hypothetical protein
MLGLKINEAKSFFFYEKILEKMDKDAAKGLSRFGAFVRRSAKSSIRKARQKSKGQLTKDERQRFHIRQRYHELGKGPKPKRPLAPSNPGEPPRSITGLLKKHIYFVYEPQRKSVVIGPASLNKSTNAPEVLEKGGAATSSKGDHFRMEKRPYMKPSFDKEYPKLARMLLGARN